MLSELIEAYKPPTYQLELRYANIVKVVAQGIMFSGIFPICLFVMTLGLIACYILDRFNIIYWYSKSQQDNAKDYLHQAALLVIAISFVLRYIINIISSFLLYWYQNVSIGFWDRILIVILLGVAVAICLMLCIFPSISFGCFHKYVTKENETVSDFHFPDKYEAPPHPKEVALPIQRGKAPTNVHS